MTAKNPDNFRGKSTFWTQNRPPENAKGRQNIAKAAISKANDLGFELAVSNPCYEFWLILHFVNWTKLIENGNSARTILSNHIKDYDKGSNVYHLLKLKTKDAVKRAQVIYAANSSNHGGHPCSCHPSTQIHRLVKMLFRIR